MKKSSVLDYLQLGFIPDQNEANSYLEKTLTAAASIEAEDTDLRKVLCRIIEDNTTAIGVDNIGIPLSGGLDSRAILGASLEVVNAGNITCVTFGTKKSPDVVRARKVCKKLGVEHHWVDVNTLYYDMDEMNENISQAYRPKMFDTVLIGQAVRPYFKKSKCIMGGYLGDSLSGAHLTQNNPNDKQEVLESFIKKNDVFKMELIPKSTLIEYFGQFLDQVSSTIPDLPGMTKYDILDLSWRQALRIRPSTRVTNPYEPSTGITKPFEDPRWVAFWYHSDLEERRKQYRYKKFLATSFPHVFQDLNIKTHDLPLIIFKKIHRRLSGFNKTPLKLLVKGDPRRNISLKKIFDVLAAEFDKLQIVKNWSAQKELQILMENPKKVNMSRLRVALSATFHIRHGRLDQHIPSFFDMVKKK